MKTVGLLAGFGVWLVTIVAVMLSTFIPDMGVRFLNLARPHILIAFIIAVVYSLHRSSRDILPRRGERIIDTRRVFLYGAVTAISTHAAYFLTISILPRDIVENQMQLMLNLFPRDFYELSIHIALTWVLFTPVEELLFRGLIHRFISTSLGEWVSALVSSMLFALSHFNVIQIPVAFIVGVAAARILDRTNNIVNSIGVHAFNNTVALVVSFLVFN